MIRRYTRIKGVKTLITFLIVLISLSIVFPMVFNFDIPEQKCENGVCEDNYGALGALALFSLVIALVISAHRKGYALQGHLPITFGVVFLAGGIIAILFSVGYEGFGVSFDKQFNLNSRSQGLALGAIFIAVLSIISGLKLLWDNRLFLGNIGGRGRR